MLWHSCYFYIGEYLLANWSNLLGFFVVLRDLWLWSSAEGCVLQAERHWPGGWRDVWPVHPALFSEAVPAPGLPAVPVGGRSVGGREYWQANFRRRCIKARVTHPVIALLVFHLMQEDRDTPASAVHWRTEHSGEREPLWPFHQTSFNQKVPEPSLQVYCGNWRVISGKAKKGSGEFLLLGWKKITCI